MSRVAYTERTLGPRPRPTLTIDGEEYDVDYAGMDDGHDRRPEATFRFLLELGRGLMLHRWVVAASQPDAGVWFDNFWTKDCAVAEVEEEEHGAVTRARCAPFVFPPLHAAFVLESPQGPRRFGLVGATFEADVEPGARRVVVRFALEGAELTWAGGPDARAAWRLAEGGAERALEAGERVTFADPLARVR